MDVLGDHLDLAHLGRAAFAEGGDQLVDQPLGGGGARAEADGVDPLEPGRVDRRGLGDEVGLAAGGPGDLDQADRVGGVLGPDDQHQLAVAGQGLDRGLPVLGGVADVVGTGAGQHREPLAQGADDPGGLVDREGGLGEVGDPLGVGDLHLGRLVLVADEVDGPGRVAHGADDLLVPLVADEHDVVALGGELARLLVDLGHQRAGGVDHPQPAGPGLGVHRRGDAVGREHHRRALGHLVELLDEDRPPGLEVPDHVQVVDDLLAHVDRGAVGGQGDLDDVDGPLDAGAVAAGGGQQHPAGGGEGWDGEAAHAPILSTPAARARRAGVPCGQRWERRR